MVSFDSANGAGTSVAHVRSGGEDINWEALTAKLPVGRDTGSALRRSELFDRFDSNKNGYLSLAEVDRALRDVMGLDSMYSSKPVLIRAFQAAKDANRTTKSKATRKDDYVERDEFRLLLGLSQPLRIRTGRRQLLALHRIHCGVKRCRLHQPTQFTCASTLNYM